MCWVAHNTVSFHSWLNNIVKMQGWPLDRYFLCNCFHSLILSLLFQGYFPIRDYNKSVLILQYDLQTGDRQVGEFAQLYFHLWSCHLPWQGLDWTIYHIDCHFCCLWSLSYFIGCLVIQIFPKLNCSCIKTIKKFHPVLDEISSWLIFICTLQIISRWNRWVHLPSSWATQTQKWDEKNYKGHSGP